jgi:phosphatidylserine decarboxylase
MQQIELPLAREGMPFILFGGFATLILALIGLPFVALLCLAVTGWMVYFFRDPNRILPDTPGAIISPADGKVIVAREIEDDRFLKTRVMKISIFMNIFNVHVNRIPFAGTVERVVFSPGRFFAADNDKAALHNEYCAVTIAATNSFRYTVVQIAGLIARRIVCRAEPGDQVTAGQRFGLIRFGSRLDLYLPTTVQLAVREGEKVKAGESILAQVERTDRHAG